MANIRKTFNFRNGVQVDEDNLIVDAVGKVGIGTSVPTEALDVRGTAKIVGLITAQNIITNDLIVSGILTAPSVLIGGGVSMSNGSISGSGGGIITYFGDGGQLLNLPTSQWIDVNTGLGFTSIYAQGFVGVGTNFPIYVFQVSGSQQSGIFTSVGANGVGIDSSGNIYATGIITASSYSGSGANLSDLSATNISSGTLNTNRLPSNISVGGSITANSGFYGNVVGNVTGNINGNVIGSATTATSIETGIDISVGLVTSRTFFTGSATVGVLTATSKIHSVGSVGIKTQDPNGSLHIFDPSSSILKVQSDDESYISIGKGLFRDQQNAELTFGNTIRTYSNGKSLDIVNYDTGSINYYLNRGSSGINTGSFNWISGSTETFLMSLSYQGRLGIGVTNPLQRLHVGGSSTITNDLYVGNTLEVVNGITANSLTVDTLTLNQSLSVPLIESNVYVTSGVSTFNSIDVASFNLSTLGLGTDTYIGQLSVYNSAQNIDNLNVSNTNIGIFTSSSSSYINVDLNAISAYGIFRGVGIGTTNPACAVDFSCAGFIPSLGLARDETRYMLLPRVTSSQRNSLILDKTPEPDSLKGQGAIIYNTTTKTFQGYNGTWTDLGAAAPGIASVFNDPNPRLGGYLIANSYGMLGIGTIGLIGNIGASGIGSFGELRVGVATMATLQVNGISTFSGITTVTGPTLFSKQLNVSGVSTFGNVNVNNSTTELSSIVNIRKAASGNLTASFDIGGTATLYNDGTQRLQTSAGGVAINGDLTVQANGNISAGSLTLGSVSGATGNLNVSGVSTFAGITTVTGTTLFSKQLSVSGVSTFSQDIRIAQGYNAYFGSGNELGIFYNGSYASIQSTTKDLYINGTGSDRAIFKHNGAVELYHNGSKKFETLGAGATVTGTTFTNQLSATGIVTATGGFSGGTGGPVQISVSGTTLTFTVPGVGSTSLELF